jgi:hypothetical protein
VISSSFGWLDHSEAQRRQMLEIVDLFRDKTTLDELGFGPIRDAFSDHFFPGINTIQTRARYLLFVPWIYLRIERERIAYSQVDRRARSDQAALARALQRGGAGENDGVIGILAGDALQRTPFSIYWNGLRRLRIWRFPGTIAQYYSATHRPGPSTAPILSDDGEVIEQTRVRGWDPGLPAQPADLFESASLSLARGEAEYLVERIVVTIPESLLALCIASRRAIGNIEYPWLHPDLASFPRQLQADLEHARQFSVATFSAALLYNLLVAEKATAIGLPIAAGQIDEFRALIVDTASDRAQLKDWHLEDLWSTVSGKGHTIPYSTRQFVEASVATFVRKPLAYADDYDARRLIERRELALKGGLARLTHRRALERFSGAAGLYEQTYRWPNVQRIVGDIRAGLREKSELVEVNARG